MTNHNPGDRLTTGHTVYQFVRNGCATNMASCPHTRPLTVQELTKRRNGTYVLRYNMTLCVEADKLQPLESAPS